MKTETILLRFESGPLDGTTLQMEMEWPPPAEWNLSGLEDVGHYKMLSISEVDPVPNFILRGAEYIWVEGAVN